MELMKQNRSRRRRGERYEGESNSSSDEPDSRLMRKFKGVSRMHKDILSHPLRTLKEYDEAVMSEIGADPSRPWKYRDHNAKQVWGRNRGLQRLHAYVGDALALTKTGDMPVVQAFLVQLLKAILQVNLDAGDWRTAHLLLPTQDPLARREFGGEESEIQAIVEYRKAQHELRRIRAAVSTTQEYPQNPKQEGAEEGDPGGGGRRPGRGGRKGRGRGGDVQGE